MTIVPFPTTPTIGHPPPSPTVPKTAASVAADMVTLTGSLAAARTASMANISRAAATKVADADQAWLKLVNQCLNNYLPG
jgi:hypothetical protein